MKKMSIETMKAVILGHAAGDALGVPVEFRSREEVAMNPVTGMRGYGTFNLPAGYWSDDTSMTLCALEALGREKFSWDAVMENFGKWLYHAAFTPEKRTFDVGGTCGSAIDNYFHRGADVEHCGGREARDNGNGSLMRILPFALYAPEDLDFIEKASTLTHAHRRSQMACGIYAMILSELLEKGDAGAVCDGLRKAEARYGGEREWKHYAQLAEIAERSRDSIRSSGYVVDTLEAALWCLLTTDSYRDCVLKAVNLGQDTDTVAAVAGGLAGALYGLEGIPGEWLDTLARRGFIESLCERAWARWSDRRYPRTIYEPSAMHGKEGVHGK